ncbi:MAG: CoA transferase [Ginsengibacter sp.]
MVLEFSQYLPGPSAGLCIANTGAWVIKIENRKNGGGCRQSPSKIFGLITELLKNCSNISE